MTEVAKQVPSDGERRKWQTRNFLIYMTVGALWAPNLADTDEVRSRLYPEAFYQEIGCGDLLEASDVNRSGRERAAHDCIEAKTGRIALVWYEDQAAQTMDYVAEQSEIVIDRSFDGMLRPDVVPIKASDETVKEYLQRNPDGCFDIHDVNDYLSRIADVKMNLSEQYDSVIGISSLNNCDTENPVGGINTNDYGRRYSMLVDATDPVRGSDLDAMRLAHEYGHTNLGHASLVGDGYFSYSMYPKDGWNRLDLLKILAESKSTEYGDESNIMGSGNYSLNAAQKRQLTVPEIILGDQKDPRQWLNGEKIAYSPDDYVDGHYFSLRLNSPVKVGLLNKDFRYDAYTGADLSTYREASEAEYDQLVFDPSFGLGDTAAYGAAVYLVSSGPGRVRTLHFGYISASQHQESMNFEFTVDNQKITVQIDRSGLIFEDVSNK